MLLVTLTQRTVLSMSEDKQRITATVDEENAEWLDETKDNKSAYINQLLTEARLGKSGVDGIIREFKKKDLRMQRETLEGRVELVKDQLEELDELDAKESQEYRNEIQELTNTIKNGGRIWKGHALVKDVSNSHGKEPTEVIDDVKEECPNARDNQFEEP